MLDLATVPAGGHPLLTGNYAPVGTECTVTGPLPTTGTLPPELEGMLVRVGPNPAVVADPATYAWREGDGMVHAVELGGGQALGYRNRFVRTRKLAAALRMKPPPGPSEPLLAPANANVVAHGGRLLALSERGFPHRLGTDLETWCVDDLDTLLVGPMGAHPHLDPATGALVVVAADPFGPPYVRYHEFGRDGQLLHRTEVPSARATAHHDTAVSATTVVLLEFPVAFGPDGAWRGTPGGRHAEPGTDTRIGLLPRGAPGAVVRWVAMEPCYAFHVMNAFDDGDTVAVDLCRYDGPLEGVESDGAAFGPAALERWWIDPAGGVEVVRLDELSVELPRIDDRRAGLPYRYGYCVELGASEGDAPPTPEGLVRYDLGRDEAVHYRPGQGLAPGEPVFVADPHGRGEDEGWVLSVVYDPARDASDLVVLDPTAFAGPPVAVVHLPVRVPFGTHGTWMPAATYG